MLNKQSLSKREKEKEKDKEKERENLYKKLNQLVRMSITFSTRLLSNLIKSLKFYLHHVLFFFFLLYEYVRNRILMKSRRCQSNF